MKKLILIVIIYCSSSLFTGVSQAQWQPDVRLTNDPASSFTSENNNAWCIAANGDVVHVVWYDSLDGNWEIYYKRSADGGVSWGADTRLTNNSANSLFPSVTVSASVVHVVWFDRRDGNDEIYYKRSADGGVSWGADTRLTNSSGNSHFPSVSVSASVVHVVWYETIYEIYYKRSTNGGVSWGTDIQLTNNWAFSLHPSVSVSGQVVHVVWYDGRDFNNEIYYKRSTDGGVSWEADTRLTNNSANSWTASVSVSGSVVHVVWTDERDGAYVIYYKRSTDGGVSWGADTRLSNNSSANFSIGPSVTVSGQSDTGGVHVVWTDGRDGNAEIYYKRSTNGGVSWETDTRLTNAPDFSERPSVSVSGSVVHVVWFDYRDGNPEIYYKRNLGNPTGIININSEIPNSFFLSQNYPNPFNPKTVIRYSLIENGFVKLKVYDILGNEVAELISQKQNLGSYSFEFDASNYPSGIYYYKLTSGNYSETKNMIMVK